MDQVIRPNRAPSARSYPINRRDPARRIGTARHAARSRGSPRCPAGGITVHDAPESATGGGSATAGFPAGDRKQQRRRSPALLIGI
jgi:hypothetical protein